MSHISEAEIQAYIDGELTPEHRARLDSYIEQRPEEARRIREVREDMAVLRRYFTAAEAQIPDRRLAETVRLIVDHAPRHRRLHAKHIGLRTAALLAFLLVGSATMMGVKLSMTMPAFADAAGLAYQNAAKEPAGAEDDAALNPQLLIEWLNANTGLVIRVPYSEDGFRLTDGRLVRFEEHPAGLLVYEDWRQHRVIIFVTRFADGEDPEPHFAIDGSAYISYWSHNGVGVAVAAANRRDLEEFTRATRRLIDISIFPPAAPRH